MVWRIAVAALLLAFFGLLLTGCSTLTPDGGRATGGGANYVLERGPDGACRIIANSAREAGPATVRVDGDSCSLSADVERLEAIPVTPSLLRALMGHDGR